MVRRLEIISEASRRLPEALKARHPTIPWKEIACAGNIYRHDYDGISSHRIWATMTIALPSLRQAIASELNAFGRDTP